MNCESQRTTNVVLVDFVDQHSLPCGFGLLADLVKELASDSSMADVRKEMADEELEQGRASLTILRMKSGFSQVEFAEKLGTSQAAVSRLESGLQEPKLSTMKRISEILNVDLNALGVALDNG